MFLMLLGPPGWAADIPLTEASSLDPWAQGQVEWMIEESDSATLDAKVAAVIAAETYDHGVRLLAGARALTNARAWEVSAADERLWLGAGLSEDDDIRQAALLGSQLGAVRGIDGQLSVPDHQALVRWMDARAEMVHVDWWLQANADEAIWRPGEPGESDLSEPRTAHTWTVRVGYRLENDGAELARTLDLPADCRSRVLSWETVHTAPVLTYTYTYAGYGLGYSSGLGYGTAIVPIPRSDEVPERPDQCLSRDQVLEAVEIFNHDLQDTLGLGAYQLEGPPAGPPPIPFRPTVDPAEFAADYDDE